MRTGMNRERHGIVVRVNPYESLQSTLPLPMVSGVMNGDSASYRPGCHQREQTALLFELPIVSRALREGEFP